MDKEKAKLKMWTEKDDVDFSVHDLFVNMIDNMWKLSSHSKTDERFMDYIYEQLNHFEKSIQLH